MSGSFDSVTSETLGNIPFDFEMPNQLNSIESPHIKASEKKTTRNNIKVKNKKPRHYFPLGVFTVNFIEKSNNELSQKC